MFKHADIIPLIGGMTLGSEVAFGSRPDYLLSFSPFKANDSHLVNYYDHEVPYILLDEGGRAPHKVDVVSSTCPCAGLSLVNVGNSFRKKGGQSGPDNPKNEWMQKVANYVLGEIRPEVYWGENAPQLAGKMGWRVREQLHEAALRHGYSLTIYTTESKLHGVPQVRRRSFYIFVRGDRALLLDYIDKPYIPIEDVILNAEGNSQRELVTNRVPTQDTLYRFILKKHGDISHRDFVRDVFQGDTSKPSTIYHIAEKLGNCWSEAEAFARSVGDEREAEHCAHRRRKLEAGAGFMRWGTSFAKGYMGAFVTFLPTYLTHPVEDRYLSYRECMAIMGLPRDFQLLNPKKNLNHVCQNVPLQTAASMANEVKEYLLGRRKTVPHRFIIQRNRERRWEVPEIARTAERSSLEELFVA